MSSGGIEMDNLSGPKTNLSRVIPESTPSLTSNAQDRVVAAWTFTAAAFLFLIASLLTLAPRFLLFASTAADEERRNALSPLEAFLALHFGVFLYAIVAALVFNIPSDSPVEQRQSTTPAWHPLLLSITVAAVLGAFFAYNTSGLGPLGLLFTLADCIIGVFGLWTMAFAGSSYVSRKTGADKRTSRFLFGNKAAASSQKKEWKQQQAKRF